jgi:SulP family sulfate permease
MKLQSYLFFGTINYVEERARALLDQAAWNLNPIRFLIMDLSLCLGVDLSAAEAFVRIQRILASKGVSFILCGFTADSTVGRALTSVDLFASENVELFASMNEAMEWTENAYLKAWFLSQKSESELTSNFQAALTLNAPRKQFMLEESFENSPRRSHLHRAGGHLMATESSEPPSPLVEPEPIPTLIKVFSGYDADLRGTFFLPILPYLKRIPIPEGHILWNQGDAPDGLYVIASGVMRANYVFDNATISESMVSGTLAGELSALSGMPRNATVVAERQSVLWKLSLEDMEKFEVEAPEAARKFTKLVLRVAKNDYDVLVSACSRL